MTKNTGESAARYHAQAEAYGANIKAILKEEKDILLSIKPGDPESPTKKLILAEEMLNLVSNYVVMNGVSTAMQKAKDEDSLTNARKALYKSIIYLEEVVTAYVDVPFSDYKEKLEAIESVSPADRYFLMKKLGFTIDLVAKAYPDNTKWKWAFVELKGRFATVAKNLLDLEKAAANSDPRSPHYEPTLYHMRLVKKHLGLAAERYREKYELSSKSTEDFNRSLSYLSALRRLYILTGGRTEAETIKKKLDIWNSKLAADTKRLKAESKKKLAGR